MKLKLKRTLAFALAFMMSISSVAFADGTKIGTDGKGTTPILVEQEATNFDVVIPLTLPVEMDGDGVVTTSNSAKIINNSFGPIQVENIELQNKDWKLIKFDSDLSKLKIGSNQIGFKIGNDKTTDNGDFTFTQQDSFVINGGNNKLIEYNAILSPVRNKVEDINAIDTIFTIDWYAEEKQVAPQEEKYTGPLRASATLSDGSKIDNLTYNYIWYDEDGNNIDSWDITTMKVEGTAPEDCSYIFAEHFNLTSLDLSNFDTSNVTTMRGMFDNCSGLTSLDLSNFDTSNVTDMGSMFDYCSGLTSLDLSNFNTSNVTNMGSMFANCSSLTTLNVSNFDTSNVTNMVDMFSFCANLTTLDLSNFNTSKVTYMGGMFGFCANLTTLDLSNFNTSKVTYMGYMFSSCYNIKQLTTTDQKILDAYYNGY